MKGSYKSSYIKCLKMLDNMVNSNLINHYNFSQFLKEHLFTSRGTQVFRGI